MMAQLFGAAVLVFFYGLLWHDQSAEGRAESKSGRRQQDSTAGVPLDRSADDLSKRTSRSSL